MQNRKKLALTGVFVSVATIVAIVISTVIQAAGIPTNLGWNMRQNSVSSSQEINCDSNPVYVNGSQTEIQYRWQQVPDTGNPIRYNIEISTDGGNTYSHSEYINDPSTNGTWFTPANEGSYISRVSSEEDVLSDGFNAPNNTDNIISQPSIQNCEFIYDITNPGIDYTVNRDATNNRFRVNHTVTNETADSIDDIEYHLTRTDGSGTSITLTDYNPPLTGSYFINIDNPITIPDGEYDLVVRVIDKAGNITNSSPTTLYVDRVTPIVTANVNNPIGSVNPTETFNFTASDASRGDRNIVRIITTNLTNAGQNGNINNNGLNSPVEEFEWIPSGLDEGTHTIEFCARDAAANTGTGDDCYSLTITIDNTAPDTVITSPTNNSYWNNTISVIGQSTDSDATLVNNVVLEYSDDGQITWNEITTISNTNNINPLDWSNNWTPSTEGSYDIRALAIDNTIPNGNQEIQDGKNTVTNVTYDITKPEVSIITPNTGNSIKGQFPVKGEATDNLSGINNISIDLIDQSTGNIVYTFNTTFNTPYWAVNINDGTNNVDNGVYTIRAKATDNAGNTRTTKIEDITIDNEAPTIWEVTAIPTPDNDNTPDYTFGTSESGTITYGGSCSSITTDAVTGDNTITLNQLADGTYTDCTIQVTDSALNQSNVLDISDFIIDTTPPTVPSNTHFEDVDNNAIIACGSLNNDDSTVAAWDTSTDSLSGLYYYNIRVTSPSGSVLNDDTTDTTYNIDYSEGAGTYSYRVRARDNAGNYSAWSTACEITVDNTTPVVRADLANPTGPVNTLAVFTFTASDFQRGDNIITNITVSDTNGVLLTDGAYDSVEETFTWTPTNLSDGDHTITFCATDAAGNTGTGTDCYELTLTVDTQAPVVTADSNNPTTPVTSSTVFSFTASDDGRGDQPVVAIYNTPVIGTLGTDGDLSSIDEDFTWMPTGLTDGNHSVTFCAEDEVGNIGTGNDCYTLDIEVDNTAPIAPTGLNYFDTDDQVTIQCGGANNDDEVRAEWNSVIDASGIDYYEIEVTKLGANGFNYTANTGTDTYYDIDTSSGDGVYQFRVRATDTVGNTGEWSDPACDITRDTVAPEVTVDELLTSDNTPQLTGTVNDPNAVIVITVNGQNHTATNNGDGTWTLVDNTLSTLTDGTYDVEADATDLAGNLGEDITVNELTIDSTPPEQVTWTNEWDNGPYYTKQQGNIKVEWNNINTDTVTYTYNWDGFGDTRNCAGLYQPNYTNIVTVSAAYLGAANPACTGTPLLPSEQVLHFDGNNTFNVFATDHVGLTGLTSTNLEIIRDSIDPTISLTNTDGDIVDSIVNYTFEATDPNELGVDRISGIKTVEVVLRNSNGDQVLTTEVFNTNTHEQATLNSGGAFDLIGNNLPVGEYTVCAISEDNADDLDTDRMHTGNGDDATGNRSTEECFTFIYDDEAPLITAFTPEVSGVYTGDVQFIIDVTDQYTGGTNIVNVTATEGTIVAADGAFDEVTEVAYWNTGILSTGTHTVTFCAEDEAGNIGTDTQTTITNPGVECYQIEIEVDNSAPIITTNFDYNDIDGIISIEASDVNLGDNIVVELEATINGAQYPVVLTPQDGSDDESVEEFTLDVSSLTTGNHTVVFCAEDNIGNIGDRDLAMTTLPTNEVQPCYLFEFNVDNNAPIISQPEDESTLPEVIRNGDSVTFEASDENRGGNDVVEVLVTVEAGPTAGWEIITLDANTTAIESFTWSATDLETGVYDITFCAMDDKGNISTESSLYIPTGHPDLTPGIECFHYDVRVDDNAPLITNVLTNENNNGVYTEEVEFAITVDDTNTGGSISEELDIYVTNLSNPGTTDIITISGGTSVEEQFSWTHDLPTGEYELVFCGVDEVGNEGSLNTFHTTISTIIGEECYVVEIEVDRNAPIITTNFNYDEDNGVITIEASDVNLGNNVVVELEATINGGQYPQVLTPTDGTADEVVEEFELDVTGFSTGTHTVVFCAEDEHGNIGTDAQDTLPTVPGTECYTFTFGVDNNAPIITAATLENGDVIPSTPISSTYVLNITADDGVDVWGNNRGENEVVSMTAEIENADGTAVRTDDTTLVTQGIESVFNWSPTDLETGDYIIRFCATDAAGNEGEWEKVTLATGRENGEPGLECYHLDLSVDNNPPLITNFTPEIVDGEVLDGTETFTITVSDENTGGSAIETLHTTAGTLTVLSGNEGIDVSITYEWDITDLGTGEHTVTFCGEDVLANLAVNTQDSLPTQIGTECYEVTFTIDENAPIITAEVYDQDAETLTLTASDENLGNSDVVRLEVFITLADGTIQNTTYNADPEAITTDFEIDLSALPFGSHDAVFCAVDEMENIGDPNDAIDTLPTTTGNECYTRSLVIDNLAPIISEPEDESTLPEVIQNGDSITLTVSDVDRGDNDIVSLEVTSIDNSPTDIAEVIDSANANAVTEEFTWTATDLETGEYSILFCGRDSEDNIGTEGVDVIPTGYTDETPGIECFHYVVMVDNTPPLLDIYLDAGADSIPEEMNGDETLTIVVDDNPTGGSIVTDLEITLTNITNSANPVDVPVTVTVLDGNANETIETFEWDLGGLDEGIYTVLMCGVDELRNIGTNNPHHETVPTIIGEECYETTFQVGEVDDEAPLIIEPVGGIDTTVTVDDSYTLTASDENRGDNEVVSMTVHVVNTTEGIDEIIDLTETSVITPDYIKEYTWEIDDNYPVGTYTLTFCAEDDHGQVGDEAEAHDTIPTIDEHECYTVEIEITEEPVDDIDPVITEPVGGIPTTITIGADFIFEATDINRGDSNIVNMTVEIDGATPADLTPMSAEAVTREYEWIANLTEGDYHLVFCAEDAAGNVSDGEDTNIPTGVTDTDIECYAVDVTIIAEVIDNIAPIITSATPNITSPVTVGDVFTLTATDDEPTYGRGGSDVVNMTIQVDDGTITNLTAATAQDITRDYTWTVDLAAGTYDIRFCATDSAVPANTGTGDDTDPPTGQDEDGQPIDEECYFIDDLVVVELPNTDDEAPIITADYPELPSTVILGNPYRFRASDIGRGGSNIDHVTISIDGGTPMNLSTGDTAGVTRDYTWTAGEFGITTGSHLVVICATDAANNTGDGTDYSLPTGDQDTNVECYAEEIVVEDDVPNPTDEHPPIIRLPESEQTRIQRFNVTDDETIIISSSATIVLGPILSATAAETIGVIDASQGTTLELVVDDTFDEIHDIDLGHSNIAELIKSSTNDTGTTSPVNNLDSPIESFIWDFGSVRRNIAHYITFCGDDVVTDPANPTSNVTGQLPTYVGRECWAILLIIVDDPVIVTPTPTQLETDLVVRNITRNNNGYSVEYCNEGSLGVIGRGMTLRLENTGNGQQTNVVISENLLPGQCATYSSITCSYIGDTNCTTEIDVRATIDPENNIPESNDDNNSLTRHFDGEHIPPVENNPPLITRFTTVNGVDVVIRDTISPNSIFRLLADDRQTGNSNIRDMIMTPGVGSLTPVDNLDSSTEYFQWDLTGVPAGSYSVKFCAEDIHGNIGFPLHSIPTVPQAECTQMNIVIEEVPTTVTHTCNGDGTATFTWPHQYENNQLASNYVLRLNSQPGIAQCVNPDGNDVGWFCNPAAKSEATCKLGSDCVDQWIGIGPGAGQHSFNNTITVPVVDNVEYYPDVQWNYPHTPDPAFGGDRIPGENFSCSNNGNARVEHVVKIQRLSTAARHDNYVYIDRDGDNNPNSNYSIRTGHYDEMYRINLLADGQLATFSVNLGPNDILEVRSKAIYDNGQDVYLSERGRTNWIESKNDDNTCGRHSDTKKSIPGHLLTSNTISVSCWEDWLDWDFNDIVVIVDKIRR